ncbi:hypothetical protein [Methylocella sp.]|uniref:DUF7146 domain-containing protein n=1 Tax=Methylocella sp. TaxID=1978226 RepID=UPI0035AF7DE6
MTRLAREELAAIKDAHPLDEQIGARTKLSRANSRGIREGQCLCKPVRGKRPLWVNTRTQTWGCLARGSVCGGDVFTFLEQFDGLDFSAALRSMAGTEVVRDPEAAARMEAERRRRAQEQEALDAALAEEERARAFAAWRAATAADGTLVDAYFAHRGLEPPASKALRFSPAEPYWHAADDEGGRPAVVHAGPCILAAIQGNERGFGDVGEPHVMKPLREAREEASITHRAALMHGSVL